jgi:hypothetical protein
VALGDGLRGEEVLVVGHGLGNAPRRIEVGRD